MSGQTHGQTHGQTKCPARGVFVTGTGTDVGKTVASAWLARGLCADYWKPIQTGVAGSDLAGADAAEVARLAPGVRIHPSAVVLPDPLSPHEAARRAGLRIDPAALILPATQNPLVVEGAGGALVPINETFLMADLMQRLGLPVVVVAHTGLGTINHTLLTLEALRSRGLAVLGVVLSGAPDAANRAAIEHFGRIAVVGELPRLPTVTAQALAALPPPTPGLLPKDAP